MAETTPPGGGEVANAAAAAVAPDALTASILAKHAAGQSLTPQESGKLGWWKAQLNRLSGKGGATPGPAQSGASPGNAALVGASAPGAASGDGLPGVPPDPRIVQRTTAAILKSADNLARRFVAREARKAGADDKTLARFDSAAALPVASQELMVETSPDVLAALGMDPKSYPLTVFAGTLGLWSTNIWLAVADLREMQAERKKRDEPKPAPPATAPDPAPPAAAQKKPGGK